MESTYNGVNTMSRERWPVDSLREFSQAPVSIMIMIQPNISIMIMMQPSNAMLKLCVPAIFAYVGHAKPCCCRDSQLRVLGLDQLWEVAFHTLSAKLDRLHSRYWPEKN